MDSGKTCLALALAGLRPARAGSLRLHGEAVASGNRDRLRSSVSIVMQEPESQLLQSTVGEELAFGALNRGTPVGLVASRTGDLAERLGLLDVLESDPHDLSAGRQQLVLIAAALAEDTPVLIMDEPGAHLDPSGRSMALETVRERVRAGLSVLWITQEQDELDAADRVIVLPGAPLEMEQGVPGAQRTGATGERTSPGAAETLLTVDIGSWDGAPGPHVAISSPLTIEIPTQGLVAVEGRNGCGKSVLLGAVAGAPSPHQIGVRWSAPPVCAPALAVQYPELQIFEELAADEVVHTAVSRGVARPDALKEAERMMARIGLNPSTFLKRRTWDLSGRGEATPPAGGSDDRARLAPDPGRAHVGTRPRSPSLPGGGAARPRSAAGDSDRQSGCELAGSSCGKENSAVLPTACERQVTGKKRIDRDMSRA